MSDNRAVKENISGVTRWKKKSRKTKLMWLYCTENDLKSMTSEDISAWAVVLKEVLVQL
jgi:hypothetical protein